MPFITINAEKCKHDGICVAECPMGILEMKDKNGTPEAIAKAEELCVYCGHCVAVCPAGALEHNSWKPSDFPQIRQDLTINPEQAEQFLRSRRSIRNYSQNKVKKPLLEKVIEMASFAPSGHNAQPVNWLIIENSNEIRALNELVIEWMEFMLQNHPEIANPMHFDRVIASWNRGQDRILRGAPHIIIAHALQAARPAQVACIIALTYLELAANSIGLGTCWAGYFTAAANTYPPLAKRLGLPEGHVPFGALMVGYPKYRYHRLPSRNQPIITWR